MPYIRITTNVPAPKCGDEALHAKLAEAMTALPGVEREWTMTDLCAEHRLWFAGSDAPAAMVEVSVYGDILTADTCGQVTRRITEILGEALGIGASRIYVAYAAARHWGCGGINYE